ncbi:hypothetical protein FIBSPDRAFT_870886 [Athelia psychrophila]|uniref:BTB domain-containing protein n=1 Tax=Athelia psychrophila TaxID=1759441 RepID=A0A166AQT7_9AGAM|nr:hypothetical protein FIBSPDRAFT_870886 [Fibularhizoctonia sp. CBS 109695]
MSSAPNSTSPPSPSLVSLGGSRASSPSDVTVAEAPVDQANEPDANKSRHPQYYFEDGNVVFRIEDTLYNVHRYFFARDSTHFRAILRDTDTSHPYVMSDVSCVDFDEFLAILYPTNFRQPTKKTTAQWTSILHLAAKWDFENIKLLAIDSLAANAIPIDKIVLGRRYGITEWLVGAYEAVCTRADPLTVEEGMKLGVEDVVRISAARQVYGTSKARHESKYLAGDLGEIFRLEQPSRGRPTSTDGKEEDAIEVLEARVAEARTEYLASSTHVSCRDPGYHAGYGYTVTQRCPYCAPESDEQRGKKEAMEKQERQLGDLKSKLEERQKELAGRQGRMSSFR